MSSDDSVDLLTVMWQSNEGVLYIQNTEESIDLFMVEIMHMRHKFDIDTHLVEGLVIEHGAH